MLPEDIRNMDFGQASMPHAPEAQTPEVPYDTTTSGYCHYKPKAWKLFDKS